MTRYKAIFALLLLLGIASATQDMTNWTYVMPIDINTTVATTQTNFPALVQLNTTSATYWNTTTCANVRFLESTNTTYLNYEIESCGDSTTNGTFWVQGNYTGNALTRIYAYLGNTAVVNGENKAGTWDSNYAAVYHFTNGSALSTLDSTAKYNGTNNGSVAVAGRFGIAANFTAASSQSIQITGTTDFRNANSISAWLNPTTISGALFTIYADADTDGVPSGEYFSWGDDWGTKEIWDGWYQEAGNWKEFASNSNVMVAGSWQHVAKSQSGSTTSQLYLNGSAITTNTHSSGTPTRQAMQGQSIGRYGKSSTQYADGAIDELRISTTNRSADWIKAEYGQTASAGAVTSNGGATTIYANLTVNAGTGGTALGNVTNLDITNGANSSINATAGQNYTFTTWWVQTGNCTIQNATANITNATFTNTTSNCVVQANFTENPKGNLTVYYQTGGTAGTSQTNFYTPATFNITATQNWNYTFNNWTTIQGNCTVGNALSNETNATISSGTCNITATFTYVPPNQTIASLVVINGSGSASNFNTPANKSITANTITNYTFNNWTITAGNASLFNQSATTYVIFLNTSGNTTVQANYNYTPNMTGVLSFICLHGTCEANQTTGDTPWNASINATPATSYSFLNFSAIGNCTIENESANITTVLLLSGDCAITANFNYTGSPPPPNVSTMPPITLTFEGNGANMDGDLTVLISNVSDGSEILHNETFVNAVLNGKWFVVVGRAMNLTINPFAVNYFAYSINNSWYVFNSTGTNWHDIGALSGGGGSNNTFNTYNTNNYNNVTQNITNNVTSGISGNGTAGSVAWFDGLHSITSDAYLTYDNLTGTLSSVWFAGLLDWSYVANPPWLTYETDPLYSADNGTIGRIGACSADEWAIALTTGGLTCLQPSFANLSGTVEDAQMTNQKLNLTDQRYNESAKADYQFNDNSFNGTGNFTTTGILTAPNICYSNGTGCISYNNGTSNLTLADIAADMGNWSGNISLYTPTTGLVGQVGNYSNAVLNNYSYAQIAADIGNWSGNASSYYTSAIVDTLGNWSGNISSYYTSAITNTLGNWSGNITNYLNSTAMATNIGNSTIIRNANTSWITGNQWTSNAQHFIANGTWTKPTGITFVTVIAIGAGGGGGGSETAAAGSLRGAGGGGGGASVVIRTFNATQLNATEIVTVGTGGAGGTSGGTPTAGGDGSLSSFGTWIKAFGGGGGATSTSAVVAGGGGASAAAGGVAAAGGGPAATATGGIGLQGTTATSTVTISAEWGGGTGGFSSVVAATAAGAGGSSFYGCPGGGGGIGLSTANAGYATGGVGGNTSTYTIGTGGAGGTTGAVQSNGTAGSDSIGIYCGAGGGGGGANTAANGPGGYGGAGGIPGAGGGGAGASTNNGNGNLTKGGVGARGEVRIYAS